MRRLTTVLIFFWGAVLTFTGCSALKSANKVCTVHRVPLQKKKVPISYGLPMWSNYDRQMMEEAARSFPHSTVQAEGGCIVMKNAPKQVAVWQCPNCLQAKAEWVKQHPRPEKETF